MPEQANHAFIAIRRHKLVPCNPKLDYRGSDDFLLFPVMAAGQLPVSEFRRLSTVRDAQGKMPLCSIPHMESGIVIPNFPEAGEQGMRGMHVMGEQEWKQLFNPQKFPDPWWHIQEVETLDEFRQQYRLLASGQKAPTPPGEMKHAQMDERRRDPLRAKGPNDYINEAATPDMHRPGSHGRHGR